jgi:hypothetical protein
MRLDRNSFQRWSDYQAAKQRRLAEKRIVPGDGHTLKPLRWWQQFSRVILYLPLTVPNDRQVVYAIDTHHWRQLFSYDGKGTAALYADGKHLAESRLPAAFPVPGGAIEVIPAAFGLNRCNWVTTAGREYQLMPDRGSAEARRTLFRNDHPIMSRWIGILSLALVVVPLAVLILQLTEVALNLPFLTTRLGTFGSLLYLPIWVNIGFGFLIALAGAERLIRFRHRWVLDSAHGKPNHAEAAADNVEENGIALVADRPQNASLNDRCSASYDSFRDSAIDPTHSKRLT